MAKKKTIPQKKIRKAPQKKVIEKREYKFQKYLPYFGLAVILILAGVIRSKFLGIGFERDEGTYSYLGQLVLDGKVPFRDFFEMKFPGIFYAYATIIGIFGNTLEQIQTGFIFVNLISIVLIFFIGKKLFSDVIGLAIALSFAILSVTPHASGYTVQSEHLMLPFIFGGILLLLHAINTNKAFQFFLAGIIICFSFMIKQSGVFFILYGGLIALGYYWINKDQKFLKGIKNSLYYSAGVILLFGSFILLMIFYGVYDEMYYWIFERAGAYVSRNSFSYGMNLLDFYFTKIFNHYELFWILGMLGMIAVFFLKISTYKKFILFIFPVLSFLAIVPGFRFLQHYWIQTLPALAIMIGVSLTLIIQLLSRYLKHKPSEILVFSLFLIFVMFHLGNNSKYYFKPDHLRILREVYQMNPFPEAQVLGNFIRENTDEDDRIAVVGSEPEMYIYSGRRGVSKYHYYFSVLMSDTITFPESKDRQNAFIEDIKQEKPKYMLVFRHRNSIWASPNASYMIFSKFDAITDEDYDLICYVDMISDFDTKYIWYEDLNKYEPTGRYSILLFEKKNEDQTKKNPHDAAT